MSLLCRRTGSHVQVYKFRFSLVPMVLLAMEIPQLQFIDKVFDVCCADPAKVVRCCGRQSRPTVAARRILWTKSLTPVVAQMQIFLGRLQWRFSSCSTFDKVVVVCCAGLAVLKCRRGGDSQAPTVASLSSGTGCCMPVVCNDRCPYGR